MTRDLGLLLRTSSTASGWPPSLFVGWWLGGEMGLLFRYVCVAVFSILPTVQCGQKCLGTLHLWQLLTIGKVGRLKAWGWEALAPCLRVPCHVVVSLFIRCLFSGAHLCSAADRCAACNEELRRCYDGDEDCWVFRGVLRVNPAGQADEQGRVLVHRKCFQPGHRYSSADLLTPLPATPLGAGGSAGHQWVPVKADGVVA
mmetsp:Transcript_23473/g.63358  ORF Transcript_23473/g.63358 Transcript_23473/m.63358 type:complete len:200 (-) Transcript_23473:458-1057(-)